MNKKIYRPYSTPIRKNPSWNERWRGEDKGLITCWEVGRELRETDPELARSAEKGELPVLGWKGGLAKETKIKVKYGSLQYLAQWQGLRGNDLEIDLSKETEIICSKTNVKVIFTGDIQKFLNA